MNISPRILEVHKKSFCANVYSVKHFRMIGLIDVNILFYDGVERVTLAYYSSSGTNNGKIKGLWYPIVGIKTTTGSFIEFTDYLNFVLSNSTNDSMAEKGWLAKSLFFYAAFFDDSMIEGFSCGKHYEDLLNIGKTLKYLYENDEFCNINFLDAHMLNDIVTSKKIYRGNRHSQRENYELFMRDIFIQAQNSFDFHFN
ncbi:hypothetical protein [Lacrimispora amygdalina]|uniref:hypothetical protein n=1 Tax=Lacrimispora amygdalina TaxID=253257 RepID=UPI002E8E2F94|nr:hypothetical protein [Lacrimispora amygdalina]